MAAGAAAGALYVITGGSNGDISEDGPLRGPDFGQALGWPVVPGHPISFSDIEVVNTGAEAAVLEGVELLDAEPGLQLVGTLAAEHVGDTYVASFEDFPPDADEYGPETFRLPILQELEGYSVRPQPGAVLEDTNTHGTQLHIGLEIVAPRTKLSFESVRILYRVGERRYALIVPYAVSLCTPRSEYRPVERPCGGHLPYQEEIQVEIESGPETTAG